MLPGAQLHSHSPCTSQTVTLQEEGERDRSVLPLLPLQPHLLLCAPIARSVQGHGDPEMPMEQGSHIMRQERQGQHPQGGGPNAGQVVCRVLGCPPAELFTHHWHERQQLLPTEHLDTLHFSLPSVSGPREDRSSGWLQRVTHPTLSGLPRGQAP